MDLGMSPGLGINRDASHAILGMIAVIFIQCAIHKILMSVFLSRKFKHNESNQAWWTGK